MPNISSDELENQLTTATRDLLPISDSQYLEARHLKNILCGINRCLEELEEQLSNVNTTLYYFDKRLKDLETLDK